MSGSVKVRLELPRGSFEEERTAAQGVQGVSFGQPEPLKGGAGRGLGKAHFVEPVSAVAVVTLAWLAKRLVDHWLKSQESGVQFDLRTTPVTVSRVAGVPHGFVVIIDKNGKPTTQQAQYEKPEDLMPYLQKLLAGTGTT